MSQKINISIRETQIGVMGIAENSGLIVRVYLPNRIEAIKEQNVGKSALLDQAFSKICEYLSGKRRKFDLPMQVKITNFIGKTLEELVKIPYGETKSYKEIATRLGNSKASRIVGMACNRNPLPILIPCHRVIGSSGGLVGYDGGLDLKKYLLDLESKNSIVPTIDSSEF